VTAKLKYYLLLPSFFILFGILVFPLCYSFILAFHTYQLTNPALGWQYEGLNNFLKGVSDPLFQNALFRTIQFTFPAVTLEFLIGFGLALLLNMELKGTRVMQSVLLIPMMISTIVIGLTWRFMLHPEFGVINYLLGIQYSWLETGNRAMMTLILTDTWEWVPLTMLLMLAGLKSLPVEPFESAKIDGASTFQTFRYLTLPMLRSAIVVTIMLRLIDAFREYDKVYVLTQGGPGQSTELLTFYVYRVGFAYFHMGYASALSYLYLIIMAALALVTISALGRR